MTSKISESALITGNHTTIEKDIPFSHIRSLSYLNHCTCEEDSDQFFKCENIYSIEKNSEGIYIIQSSNNQSFQLKETEGKFIDSSTSIEFDNYIVLYFGSGAFFFNKRQLLKDHSAQGIHLDGLESKTPICINKDTLYYFQGNILISLSMTDGFKIKQQLTIGNSGSSSKIVFYFIKLFGTYYIISKSDCFQVFDIITGNLKFKMNLVPVNHIISNDYFLLFSQDKISYFQKTHWENGTTPIQIENPLNTQLIGINYFRNIGILGYNFEHFGETRIQLYLFGKHNSKFTIRCAEEIKCNANSCKVSSDGVITCFNQPKTMKEYHYQ